MRYVELIADRPLVWGLFLVYLGVTSWLAWLGHRRTDSIESFAVGTRDMHPAIVGITLAASIASTATFVINPGFVYAHGVSALVHFGVAAGGGVILGLVLLSFGFRRVGADTGALTLPHWLGARFGSPGLTTFFAAVSLLSLTFVVLIVGALSIVMQQTLGLTNTESCALIVAFVFGYVFVGGTWAHAYTNTLQGVIMAVIAAVIVASGLPLLAGGVGGFLETIAATDANLTTVVNPASPLFGSVFSVWVCGFVIGFAVVCQPHILTKALYVDSDRSVRRYLAVCIAVSLVFSALLLVGLYAHVADIPAAAFVDPGTGAFRQDLVMAAYLANTFSPAVLAVVTVAILAAGMSTLDGILVALSSIAASDLFVPLSPRTWRDRQSPGALAKSAHRASQLILVAMGAIAFVIALNPPALLGIFGQIGVYGIVAAGTVPVVIGIVAPRTPARVVGAAAAAALAAHFALYGWGWWASANAVDLVAVAADNGLLATFFDTAAPQLGLRNPAVTATYGIFVSAVIAAFGTIARRRSGRSAATTNIVGAIAGNQPI